MSATLMDTRPLPPPPDSSGAPTQSGASLPAPTTSPPAQPAHDPLPNVFREMPETSSLPRWLIYVSHWLIYLLLGGIVLLILATAAQAVRPENIPYWWGLVSQSIIALSAILPAFVMAQIEGGAFREFGLRPETAFRRNFWVGSVWGLGWLTVLMLGLRLAGAFSFGSLALQGMSILKYGAYYVVFFLVTSFFEEFLLRGYSQWTLTKSMGFWPAAALMSIGFGGLHWANPGETIVGLTAAALIGFFFCLTLRRTGDLWWAIGFHTSWNFGESYLYSVPNSGGKLPGHLLHSSSHGPDWLTGGTVGPEGSYLVFVVIIAMWIAFDRFYPQVKYGINPQVAGEPMQSST